MSKFKHLKKTLVNHKEFTSLANAADALILMGEKLKKDQAFILSDGKKETVVAPNTDIELKYKLKNKGDKYEFEVEIEWYDNKNSKKISIK